MNQIQEYLKKKKTSETVRKQLLESHGRRVRSETIKNCSLECIVRVSGGNSFTHHRAHRLSQQEVDDTHKSMTILRNETTCHRKSLKQRNIVRYDFNALDWLKKIEIRSQICHATARPEMTTPSLLRGAIVVALTLIMRSTLRVEEE